MHDIINMQSPSFSDQYACAFLICVRGKEKGNVYPVIDKAFLGRDLRNDIRLPDKMVAQRHCMFLQRNAQWHIAVYGSNGVTVDQHFLSPGETSRLEYESELIIADRAFVFSKVRP